MRPRGIVRLFKRQHLVWECANLFVDAGLPPLANLIAGVTTGQYASAVGFGSGTSAPTATDVDLGATPAYYNAISGYTFPSPGSVQFNYSLLTTDYAATGMTIQELGLFANSAAVTMPAARETGSSPWTLVSPKVVGDLIVDGNSNIQRCTVAGTTGASAPAWSMTTGGATTDGSVTWSLVAFHTAPGPLLARVSVPAFAYTGAGNYAGTWTVTF
jgi:hypothetical protein